MAIGKEIVVISPHLDDAVVSCCDHILDWKKKGNRVRILTIFTAFQTDSFHHLQGSTSKLQAIALQLNLKGRES